MKDEGLDYDHGTGHGVGCYLSVHEESANINDRSEKIVKPGMIISNEPGYYPTGEYGIRIENLVLSKKADGGNLEFETITLCPIDTNLVVPDMLSDEEVQWLNDYHQHVREVLTSLLNKDEGEWLAKATEPVAKAQRQQSRFRSILGYFLG